MKVIAVIIEQILKGFIFGILPFVLFILITSRSSILGGIRSFIVLTGSMEPTISVGTIVFTHPFEIYKLNDVIAFKKENKTVTHRIVDLESKNGFIFYRTMGDANNVSDSELITRSSVLGNVFFAIPYLGRVVFFIKTVPGYLSLIVLPAILYIIFELLNINNEMKKESEKKFVQRMNIV